MGEFGIIQYNALRSWRLGQPNSEIILFGDEAGTHKMSHKINARHYPEMATNSQGTPYINQIFIRAQEISHYDICCYVNADVILLGSIESAVQHARQKFNRFLLVTRRFDLKLHKKQNFNENWQKEIRAKLTKRGQKHRPGAIDCLIFTRGIFPMEDFPAFLLARSLWDGWLVWKAMNSGIPTVEATSTITLIHQQHVKVEDSLNPSQLTSEKNYNRDLAQKHKRSVEQTAWILTHEGLKQRQLKGEGNGC